MVGDVRISVEAWGPDYGGEVDLGPQDATVETIDVTCENRPWEPVTATAPDGLANAPLAFVDGTRRMDARLFVMDGGPSPTPGVAGSVGVGAVVCDPIGSPPTLTNGNWYTPRRAEIVECRVSRYLAIGEGKSMSLPVGPGLEFEAMPHPARELDQLADAIHERMRTNEADLATEMAKDGRLVFLDGPLAKMRPGPARVIAYIKSHNRRYLGADEEAILGKLACGERTPLFAFGEPRPRYSWYLRLCALDETQHAWHGLVRCEVPAAVSKDVAVELADAAASLLPRFASLPHWDPRAPQNLVPVAGLEKRMRHLLGDKVLVNRMIRDAARRIA